MPKADRGVPSASKRIVAFSSGPPVSARSLAGGLGAGTYQRDGDVVWPAGLDRRVPQVDHAPAILVHAEHLVQDAGGHGIGQAVGCR